MRGFPVLAFGVAVLGSLATCQNSRATVFTVLNTNDSGEGSLRQTILDANASQGRDEIRFDIPGDGSRQILLLTPLPTITDGLIIDGWSQLGASTNSLAQGFDAAIKVQLIGSRLPSGDGITISAPNCTIRGLCIVTFRGAGVYLIGASNCVVEGNLIGLQLDGSIAGNGGSGVVLTNSPYNWIGGITPRSRNVTSGNGEHGIHLQGLNCRGINILGNFIGTDQTGVFRRPNVGCGIVMFNSPSNFIGGTVPGARNIISGNRVHGIEVVAAADNNLIYGNYIGVDVMGLPGPYHQLHGIYFHKDFITSSYRGPSGNRIGGFDPGMPNLISSNWGSGIYIESGSNNTLAANSIYDNQLLGIDLNDNFVGGRANQGQLYPTLEKVTFTSPFLTITGQLQSAAFKTYNIDFYANRLCHDQGYGEGRWYLGSSSVTTDFRSVGLFSVRLRVTDLLGPVITATATDPAGNTSEFSRCISAAVIDPRLFTTRRGDVIEISWAKDIPSEFVLEQATNVSLPIPWSSFGEPVHEGLRWNVQVPASSASRFFRLTYGPETD